MEEGLRMLENKARKLKENLESMSDEDFEVVLEALRCGGLLLHDFERTREFVFHELVEALELAPRNSWERETAEAVLADDLTLIREAVKATRKEEGQ